MTGMSAHKRLSRRQDIILDAVHEWIQTLPYPHNQQVAMREQALISEIDLQVQLLIEAAYAVAKEDR